MDFVVNKTMRSKYLLLVLSTLSCGYPALAQLIQPNGITLQPYQGLQFTLTGYSGDVQVQWNVEPVSMGVITPTGFFTSSGVSGVAYIHAIPQGANASFVSIVYLGSSTFGGFGGPTPGVGPTPGLGSAPTNPSSGPSPGGPSPSSGPSPGGPSPSSGPSPAGPSPSSGPSPGGPSPSSGPSPAGPSPSSGPSPAGPSGGGVSISITPASISLQASQSFPFAAIVQGTSNEEVQWSITPNMGTISNGFYRAPFSFTGELQVTISATSLADPTKIASATVLLTQPVAIQGPSPSPSIVSISIGGGTTTLPAGQSAQFTASIQGTPNTAVTWSVTPNVGTVSNGFYIAPAVVSSPETVVLTAVSMADPSKSASVSLILQPVSNPTAPPPPPVSISLSPGTASLQAGQSVTFFTLITGTSNSAATWTINPAVGALVNGVYTAPATVSAGQTVTVTATSVADPTKSAASTVTLTPTSSGSGSGSGSGTPGTVKLPVEVLGSNGTTTSTSVTIPSGANLNGQLSLWMQIHGLRFDAQASVQVNNSGWMPISTGNVTLLGNAAAYGGIGGGFGTLKMTMNLPAGVVQTGSNTITFRFNQTDGRVSGFRVLAFNVQAADGSLLLPSSTFVSDDPSTWQAPSTNPSDIAAGQSLWHQAPLTIPVLSGGTQPILAHCSDCHTQDGRDLKYFNYSNNSIQARSVFHGLTVQQGNQIASYIRSLNVVNPGRPWNPPYQPGPGLDSQPVSNWAAGAGLDAVLDTDQEMVNAIFPGGFQPSVFAATSRLNTRELPLPVQLPDWNQWLPGTHPMDAFGSTFTTNGFNTIYQTLSATLQAGNPAVYVAQKGNFDSWFNAFYGLYIQEGTPIWNSGVWTPSNVDAMYSLAQWGLVKSWELNNQFQLEGLAQNIFGPQADPRAWYSNQPFFVSPHDLKMPTTGVTGLRNGSQADYIYLSYIWYNLQLILNDSNGVYSDQTPIDWPYGDGFVKGMGSLVSPQAGIQTMWLIKALQVMQQNGQGPQVAGSGSGWQPSWAQISLLVTPEWNEGAWTGVDPATRAAIANGVVTSWLQQANQFTPQQFYAGGLTTATAVPVPGGNAYDAVLPDWVWYTIPRIQFLGGDTALTTQLAQWAQSMWPTANWTADLNATCNWQNNVVNGTIQCSQ